MSVLTISRAPEEAQDTGVTLWRLTRDLYHRAGELGWYDNAKVELLDGMVHYKRTGKERLWTRREYEQAAALGWFDGVRVELIQGKVYVKVSQNPLHTLSLRASAQTATRVFGPAFDVRQQLPLVLSTDGMPEPDVLVVRGSWQDYVQHPTETDVVLLIEVSDTTLLYDRARKAALYAAAGIADYWLLNLNNRTLEVRRNPAPLPEKPFGFAYQSVTAYLEQEVVTCLTLPGAEIAVTQLLPPLRASASSPSSP